MSINQNQDHSIIHIDGVTKSFGELQAVTNLTLSVPNGTCYGLLGPNGAGKTTTLKMVYGVALPTKGEIQVFGMSVEKNIRSVRSRLGVTLQDNVLIENLTPRENLHIFGRHHLLSKTLLSKRVKEVIELMELESYSNVKVLKLSGGFKRRLAVAMSLINDPELLILDEPTTGLDPTVRHALWSKIRQLKAEGKTVLLTTHYMDEAERLCDRVMIMADGSCVNDGSPEELINNHLHPEAIEFDCNEGDETFLAKHLERPYIKLRSGNRLMVFVPEPDLVLNLIQKLDGGNRRPIIARPTNLEDVFLSMTGLHLREGQ